MKSYFRAGKIEWLRFAWIDLISHAFFWGGDNSQFQFTVGIVFNINFIADQRKNGGVRDADAICN